VNRQEDPQLWDLLGRAPKLEPSPFFARNVLREVRLKSPERSGFPAFSVLRRIVAPTLAAVGLALITAVAIRSLPGWNSQPGSISSNLTITPAPAAPEQAVPAPPVSAEQLAPPVPSEFERLALVDLDDQELADLDLLAEVDDDNGDDALLL
jgi:hypothetical protein